MDKLLKKLIGKIVTVDDTAFAWMSLKDNPLLYATKTVFLTAEDVQLKIIMKGKHFDIDRPDDDPMLVKSVRLIKYAVDKSYDTDETYEKISIWLSDETMLGLIRISVTGSEDISIQIEEVENG